MLQVATFYQWLKWVHSSVIPGDSKVVVNLDETAMTKCLPPRAAYASYSFKNGRRVEKARISTQDTRSHATLLACITGDAALQRHLPQFVLTNDATLSAFEKDKLKYLPAPMVWVQNTKGWMTGDILRGLLTVLRQRVREHCTGKSLLVVWDAAAQHR